MSTYNNMKDKNPAAVALGKRGGQSTSPAKIAAAKRNAKLGGRKKMCCINCYADTLQLGTKIPRCAQNGNCKCHRRQTKSSA